MDPRPRYAPSPAQGEGWGEGVSTTKSPQEDKTLSRTLPQAGEVKQVSSALVLDRNVHVLDLQLAHRLEHGPGDVRIDLDLEVKKTKQRQEGQKEAQPKT